LPTSNEVMKIPSRKEK